MKLSITDSDVEINIFILKTKTLNNWVPNVYMASDMAETGTSSWLVNNVKLFDEQVSVNPNLVRSVSTSVHADYYGLRDSMDPIYKLRKIPDGDLPPRWTRYNAKERRKIQRQHCDVRGVQIKNMRVEPIE